MRFDSEGEVREQEKMGVGCGGGEMHGGALGGKRGEVSEKRRKAGEKKRVDT